MSVGTPPKPFRLKGRAAPGDLIEHRPAPWKVCEHRTPLRVNVVAVRARRPQPPPAALAVDEAAGLQIAKKVGQSLSAGSRDAARGEVHWRDGFPTPKSAKRATRIGEDKRVKPGRERGRPLISDLRLGADDGKPVRRLRALLNSQATFPMVIIGL